MGQNITEYRQFIRKYPSYAVLNICSLESIDIYNNFTNGVKEEDVSIYNEKYGFKIGTYHFIITQWDLVETCFYSIKYSNDFRHHDMSKSDFYNILNATKRNSEILENAKGIDNNDIYKHLLCISNMQFDFESSNVINKFNRLSHIINSINVDKRFDQTDRVNYINLKNKFFEITHIEYDKYINCFLFICIVAIERKKNDIDEILNDIQFDTSVIGFSKDDIRKIITLQSKDYEFYRNFSNWNILKYNPIVHCKKENKYIISNISSLLISLSEFMYWTIRNHYNEIQSLDFTNYFGHCFEFYLYDFFCKFKINFEKLAECQSKMPDWKIETEKYVFLVEQKAALFPIDARSITSEERFNQLNNYLKNNIEDSFKQLNSYNIKSSKTIIRVCLMYEKIHFPEIVQELVLPKVKLISEEYLNWIISIDEFEKLIIILSKNEMKFNEIIEDKINKEMEKYTGGRGFDNILSGYENEYIKKDIDYCNNLFNSMLDKLKDLI